MTRIRSSVRGWATTTLDLLEVVASRAAGRETSCFMTASQLVDSVDGATNQLLLLGTVSPNTRDDVIDLDQMVMGFSSVPLKLGGNNRDLSVDALLSRLLTL
jgi:hypothetical protein